MLVSWVGPRFGFLRRERPDQVSVRKNCPLYYSYYLNKNFYYLVIQ